MAMRSIITTPNKITEIFAILSSILLSYYLWRCNANISQELTHLKSSLNFTHKFLVNHNEDVLIFPRVPKTASLAINRLFEYIREQTNVSIFSAVNGMPEAAFQNLEYIYEMNYDTRKRLVDAIINEPKRPLVYTRHQNFLDFNEYYPAEEYSEKKVQPLYFSFVRDPVERAISWYYYVRNNEYQFEKNGKLKSDILPLKFLKESFEECVEAGRGHCRYQKGMSIHHSPSYISQMSFFCGHEPICDSFESKALFHKALENLDKHFAVVGVAEYFNQSVQVLEAHLPKFFAGSMRIMSEESDILYKNRNLYKPKTSNRVKSLLAQNMSLEIEFYRIAKQRLFQQLKTLDEDHFTNLY